MPKLQIFVRYVYGNARQYPYSPNAETFAQLLGVKTFNNAQIALIKQLGFDVEIVADPNVQS